MKVVIDTNSLLSLVRYYLPFDHTGVLFQFIKKKIENGEIIIIDKVLEECNYISKGIVISKLGYLSDTSFQKSFKVPFKTDSLLAPAPTKLIRLVESQFVNTIVRKLKKLTDTEFENKKNAFLESADMKQIILCLNLQKDGKKVVLVSEETERSNDNKLFKKIPAICKILDIETMTLPELLGQFKGIEIDFQ